MTPIRVLICEDEPLARDTLRDFIAEQPQLVLVGEAADGAQALKLIRALQPDLVFMDIQMPELTGLEVVRQLDTVPPLIFTTAYDQHAVTAFELNAVDYLLKPFTQERFDAAVQRALHEALPPQERQQAAQAALGERDRHDAPLTRILVRDRGRIFPVALADIEHLKSDLKYTQITARGNSYLVRMALTDLEAKLDPSRFLRVHRNAIVNLDFVESMKPDEQSQLQIRMRDGTELLANRDASRRLRDEAL
ncbi:LytR/AlgR family response regulator transcription factor [Inhella crocodyli]|uniref:Response regulator transcription factor n=1 Tax=Inhella crocodyli TaxID=2499851 RepID=A0A437LHT1_9BURK|nr:LytTR family DNA-binding domain-containing protein [Inhella crocodyli]RVT84929.1 response regulator transcription factor [Inhella crocodyli]